MAIARHLHGKLKGITHRLSSIDKKYMGVGWTKFIPGATAEHGGSDIPGVGIGMAYAAKYGGTWVVLGHSHEKSKAEGCKKIPAAIRAELSSALKHVDFCMQQPSGGTSGGSHRLHQYRCRAESLLIP